MATTANSVYPKSYVGFDSITSQIEKKLVKRGFQFNIICVGTCILTAILPARR
jgi:septin 3/9/12